LNLTALKIGMTRIKSSCLTTGNTARNTILRVLFEISIRFKTNFFACLFKHDDFDRSLQCLKQWNSDTSHQKIVMLWNMYILLWKVNGAPSVTKPGWRRLVLTLNTSQSHVISAAFLESAPSCLNSKVTTVRTNSLVVQPKVPRIRKAVCNWTRS
jgi:hypothetical protein